jgi:hypothetical protein
MSYLTACQPGWLAVFENVNGGGFSTEPIACWLYADGEEPSVRPVCSMGRHMCDATLAGNFLGVAAPGTTPDAIYTAEVAARTGRRSA